MARLFRSPSDRPPQPARTWRLRAVRRRHDDGRTTALDVVWRLRHLGALRGIDWSDAQRDPHLVEVLARAFAGLYDRYFRVDAHGFENIPPGAVILVGNHSGFGVAELLMGLVAWARHYGPDHPVYALAHRWLYKTPFVRVAVSKIGGVPAGTGEANAVLRAGHPLAIYPGGELESTRPFSERYRVNLHGRRGFVRIALANDVPVVPFVTVGSHATLPMPPGMHALATVTGARRYLGLEAVPLPLQVVAWILGAVALDEHVISSASFLLLLLATPPLYPSKIVLRFGEPIPSATLRALASCRDGIDAAYRRVEGVMQGMMDEAAAERRSIFA